MQRARSALGKVAATLGLFAAVASIVAFGAGAHGIKTVGLTRTAVNVAPASAIPPLGAHAVPSRNPGRVIVGPMRRSSRAL